jgi:hypothetical protein
MHGSSLGIVSEPPMIVTAPLSACKVPRTVTSEFNEMLAAAMTLPVKNE